MKNYLSCLIDYFSSLITMVHMLALQVQSTAKLLFIISYMVYAGGGRVQD